MTKKRLKQLFLVPLLAVIFYACYLDVLEVEVSETTGFSIAEARSWFEANVPSMPDGVSLRSGDESDDPEDGSSLPWRVGDRSSLFMPDWQNAVVGTDARFRIIEVPLQGSERIVQISSELAERAVETGDERYLATIMRLLVRICHATGARDGFVMIASPDLKYLSRNLDNPMQNFTYLNRSEDFSGLVFYYNLAGGFVTGYKAAGGEFFRFVPQTQADDDEIQLRGAMYCHISCTTTSFWWDWFTRIGDDVYFTGSTYLGSVTHCHIVSCFSGDGGIGGTGGGNGSTEPEQTRAEDIFRTSNMSAEDRRRLTDFFNEMLGNCMGEALVDALAGELNRPGRPAGRINIQFTDERVANWNFSTSTITLWRNARPDTFFHEMFHAFQSFRETSGPNGTLGNALNNPLLNLEMETRFAQYMFLRNRQGFAGSALEEYWERTPSRNEVAQLAEFIDHNGFFLPGISHRDIIRFDNRIRYTVLPTLRRVPEHVKLNMRYDLSRIGIANFRSLRMLTIDCPPSDD